MSGNRGYEVTKRLRGRSRASRGSKAKKVSSPLRSGVDDLACQVEDYLEWLAVRNYSLDTLEDRRFSLDCFLEWCRDRSLFEGSTITLPILESYQRTLHRHRKANGKPLAASSQRNRLMAVRDFFRWLCRSGRIPWNPASELELPRPEKRLPEDPPTSSQIEAILRQPDLEDPLGLRDRAMLEVFYSTGMRRCEIVHLLLHDPNFERATIRIRQGKGKKDRVVPIGERALSWLERYLDEVRPLLAVKRGENALFLSSYGEAFNPDVLSRKVSKYIKQAEIGKGGSCHLFRHACATHMLEGGADIRFIQQLLGHESLETTQIYTEVSIRQLQEVHARTHPANVAD